MRYLIDTQILYLANLPFHHKNPFDRLLISQAIIEKLPIISADNHFKLYDINLIW